MNCYGTLTWRTAVKALPALASSSAAPNKLKFVFIFFSLPNALGLHVGPEQAGIRGISPASKNPSAATAGGNLLPSEGAVGTVEALEAARIFRTWIGTGPQTRDIA